MNRGLSLVFEPSFIYCYQIFMGGDFPPSETLYAFGLEDRSSQQMPHCTKVWGEKHE